MASAREVIKSCHSGCVDKLPDEDINSNASRRCRIDCLVSHLDDDYEDKLQGELDRCISEKGDLQAEIDNLKFGWDTCKDELEALRKKLANCRNSEEFDVLAARNDELEANFEAYKRDTERRIKELEDKIGTLERNKDFLTKKVETLSEQNDDEYNKVLHEKQRIDKELEACRRELEDFKRLYDECMADKGRLQEEAETKADEPFYEPPEAMFDPSEIDNMLAGGTVEFTVDPSMHLKFVKDVSSSPELSHLYTKINTLNPNEEVGRAIMSMRNKFTLPVRPETRVLLEYAGYLDEQMAKTLMGLLHHDVYDYIENTRIKLQQIVKPLQNCEEAMALKAKLDESEHLSPTVVIYQVPGWLEEAQEINESCLKKSRVFVLVNSFAGDNGEENAWPTEDNRVKFSSDSIVPGKKLAPFYSVVDKNEWNSDQGMHGEIKTALRTKSVVVFAMGYSGTGKTTALMGRSSNVRSIAKSVEDRGYRLTGATSASRGVRINHKPGAEDKITSKKQKNLIEVDATSADLTTQSIVNDLSILGLILPTMNNPQSSRAMTIYRYTHKDADKRDLLIADLPGHEDPQDIFKHFKGTIDGKTKGVDKKLLVDVVSDIINALKDVRLNQGDFIYEQDNHWSASVMPARNALQGLDPDVLATTCANIQKDIQKKGNTSKRVFIHVTHSSYVTGGMEFFVVGRGRKTTKDEKNVITVMNAYMKRLLIQGEWAVNLLEHLIKPYFADHVLNKPKAGDGLKATPARDLLAAHNVMETTIAAQEGRTLNTLLVVVRDTHPPEMSRTILSYASAISSAVGKGKKIGGGGAGGFQWPFYEFTLDASFPTFAMRGADFMFLNKLVGRTPLGLEFHEGHLRKITTNSSGSSSAMVYRKDDGIDESDLVQLLRNHTNVSGSNIRFSIIIMPEGFYAVSPSHVLVQRWLNSVNLGSLTDSWAGQNKRGLRFLGWNISYVPWVKLYQTNIVLIQAA